MSYFRNDEKIKYRNPRRYPSDDDADYKRNPEEARHPQNPIKRRIAINERRSTKNDDGPPRTDNTNGSRRNAGVENSLLRSKFKRTPVSDTRRKASPDDAGRRRCSGDFELGESKAWRSKAEMEDSPVDESLKWKHDLYEEKRQAAKKIEISDIVLLVKNEQDKFNKAYAKLLEKHRRKIEKIHNITSKALYKEFQPASYESDGELQHIRSPGLGRTKTEPSHERREDDSRQRPQHSQSHHSNDPYYKHCQKEQEPVRPRHHAQDDFNRGPRYEVPRDFAKGDGFSQRGGSDQVADNINKSPRGNFRGSAGRENFKAARPNFRGIANPLGSGRESRNYTGRGSFTPGRDAAESKDGEDSKYGAARDGGFKRRPYKWSARGGLRGGSNGCNDFVLNINAPEYVSAKSKDGAGKASDGGAMPTWAVEEEEQTWEKIEDVEQAVDEKDGKGGGSRVAGNREEQAWEAGENAICFDYEGDNEFDGDASNEEEIANSRVEEPEDDAKEGDGEQAGSDGCTAAEEKKEYGNDRRPEEKAAETADSAHPENTQQATRDAPTTKELGEAGQDGDKENEAGSGSEKDYEMAKEDRVDEISQEAEDIKSDGE